MSNSFRFRIKQETMESREREAIERAVLKAIEGVNKKLKTNWCLKSFHVYRGKKK